MGQSIFESEIQIHMGILGLEFVQHLLEIISTVKMYVLVEYVEILGIFWKAGQLNFTRLIFVSGMLYNRKVKCDFRRHATGNSRAEKFYKLMARGGLYFS